MSVTSCYVFNPDDQTDKCAASWCAYDLWLVHICVTVRYVIRMLLYVTLQKLDGALDETQQSARQDSAADCQVHSIVVCQRLSLSTACWCACCDTAVCQIGLSCYLSGGRAVSSICILVVLVLCTLC